MTVRDARVITWDDRNVTIGSSLFAIELTWSQIRVIRPHEVFPFIHVSWSDVVSQHRRVPNYESFAYLDSDRVEENLVAFLDAAKERLGDRVEHEGWWAREPGPFEEIDPSQWPRKSTGGYRGAGNRHQIVYQRKANALDRVLSSLFGGLESGEPYFLKPTKCVVTDTFLFAAGRSKKIYRAPLSRLHRGLTIGHVVENGAKPFGVLFGRRAFLRLRVFQDDPLLKVLHEHDGGAWRSRGR